MSRTPPAEPLPARARRRLGPVGRGVLAVGTLAFALVTGRDASTLASAPDPVAPPSAAPAHEPASAHEPPAAPPAAAPYFAQSWLAPEGHTPSAHGSAICLLPSGRLFAVWYGGSREGQADVAIFGSRLTPETGAWSDPVRIVDRATAEAELDRRIKKVGNAVVFSDRSGVLWLIYVTVSVGGWSGSALNIKTSQDEGDTWTPSQRLTLNPFLNISSLVRNKPILADDGRIGVPVYHEFARKFPQMLWISPGPDGRIDDYEVRNLAGESGLIQPALVPLGGDRVLMVLRDGTADRRMRTAYSEDDGWTWSETVPSDLPNPDSAIDALQLRDGRILLAYNHAVSGRENLRLALSSDQGRTWRAGPVIEAASRKEFSYPQLAEDAQGRIHLTYTWQRRRIRHVAFNLAWLDRAAARPKVTTMR